MTKPASIVDKAKPLGLIFDFDGTLVDSLGQALESFNYALQKIGEPSRTAVEIKRYFGRSADRIFNQLLEDHKQAERAFEFYKEHQTQLAPNIHLHPGIREMLDELKLREIPLSIVTGRHAEDLAIILKPHGIADRFSTRIADSELKLSKPNPEGLLLAAQRMQLLPSQTVYIGDSMVDIQAAHRAGARSIAALWDTLADRQALEHEHPDFMAERPKQILDWI